MTSTGQKQQGRDGGVEVLILLAPIALPMLLASAPLYVAVLQGQRAAAGLLIGWQLVTVVYWATGSVVLFRSRGFARIVAAGALAAGHVVTLMVATAVARAPFDASGDRVARLLAVLVPADVLTVAGLLGAAGHLASRRALRETDSLKAELLSARLLALDRQLSPHVLFNALNGVVVLVRRGESARAERMLLALSRFLREVLREEGDELVPLSRELSLVEDLLAVEKERFGRPAGARRSR